MPIHQQNRVSMRTVRITPRCREVSAWHVSSTQGRAHQRWNVDAGGIGCGWRKAVPGLGCGRSLDQEGCFVVSAVESAVGGKTEDVGD